MSVDYTFAGCVRVNHTIPELQKGNSSYNYRRVGRVEKEKGKAE